VPVHYLWLVPEPRAEARFAAVIDSLARRYAGPRFDPHVTLLGTMEADPDELTERMHRLATVGASFSQHALEVGYLDDYYRSLFVGLELGPQLGAVREAAQDMFAPWFEGRPYGPHLSLFYGPLARADKQRLCSELRDGLPMTFRVDRLRLVAGGDSPEAWREIATLPLGNAG
jgi:2'-5' RNA ligase